MCYCLYKRRKHDKDAIKCTVVKHDVSIDKSKPENINFELSVDLRLQQGEDKTNAKNLGLPTLITIES